MRHALSEVALLGNQWNKGKGEAKWPGLEGGEIVPWDEGNSPLMSDN